MGKLETMEHAGSIGETIFTRLQFILEPGVTTGELNKVAAEIIEYNGATAEFKGYGIPGVPPFPAETCISINEEVCHGVPGDRVIGGGDLVSIDMGIRLRDYVVDACRTYEVGEVSPDADFLNYWTLTALRRAKRHIKAGVCWNNVARIIEGTAINKGLSVVKDMSGHGIGKELHESPTLRNYACEENEEIFLEEDQTICVEPMFSFGGGEMEIAENQWTVLTKDRSISAHWEYCLRVTKTGCEILF